MTDITSVASGLYLFLKVHFPSIAGAIFSSKKVPRNDLTVIYWISTWAFTNIIGLIFIVILSHYVGGWAAERYNLSDMELSLFRLILGLFGLKIIGYLNEKIEPIMTEIVDALLEKFRVSIGLSPKEK